MWTYRSINIQTCSQNILNRNAFFLSFSIFATGNGGYFFQQGKQIHKCLYYFKRGMGPYVRPETAKHSQIGEKLS